MRNFKSLYTVSKNYDEKSNQDESMNSIKFMSCTKDWKLLAIFSASESAWMSFASDTFLFGVCAFLEPDSLMPFQSNTVSSHCVVWSIEPKWTISMKCAILSNIYVVFTLLSFSTFILFYIKCVELSPASAVVLICLVFIAIQFVIYFKIMRNVA